MLSPGERVEIVVTARFSAGQPQGLLALPYNRGKAMGPELAEPLTLADVHQHGRVATPLLPTNLRTISALGTPAVRRTVEFAENMADPAAMFLINGKKFDMNRVDFVGKVGQIEEWDIVSKAHMDHPFHLHGTQFQVLARTDDGIWQDEPFLALARRGQRACWRERALAFCSVTTRPAHVPLPHSGTRRCRHDGHAGGQGLVLTRLFPKWHTT
ncbi:multicopper oxidase domain-containing protein [Paludibacterium denitrificans]|uniref:multicopper oxidase domain-containing protein n=1 Tax=Paludibacterium denitrificans TaxID=2675226 RepID=UPI001E45CE7F